jgi:hypothetical protein
MDSMLKCDKHTSPTNSTPSFAYAGEAGERVGFKIDMAHAIARDLLSDPNEVEFVVVPSGGRFPCRAMFTEPKVDRVRQFLRRHDDRYRI